jgi:hypothetical protein
VFFGVFFNTLNPLTDLRLLEFFKALAKRVVKFLDIFKLLTLLNDTIKHRKTFHRFVDSVEEATGPVKSACNWRHVRANG